MTLTLDTAPAAVRSPPRPQPIAGALSGWDWVALGVLAALWAVLFLLRYDALPVQLWDESRNANNALELAWHGRWLTPTYAGVVDHWNTKPPLLIWAMAGGLRLGLPPLIALRLTSWLAAAATVASVWGVLRFQLRDRVAAFAGGVLLLSAVIYVGPHAARTGDYDCLESAFLLGYVLSFWKAFDSGRTRWLFLAALLMALGVLTKGVAVLLPLPGLGLYALSRPARLAAFLKNGRSWAAMALFAAIAGGYYLARESYDPGYLSVVADNELGGRFLRVTEKHQGGWDFYLRALLRSGEPCAALAALAPFTLGSRPPRRQSLALACGLAAVSLLVVLSVSRSKMEWYATPLVPLLSVVAALGLTDALSRLQARRPRWASLGRAGAAAALAGGALYAAWYNQAQPSWNAGEFGGAHVRYGEFLDTVRMQASRLRTGTKITVVDSGFYNDAGFGDYDPMLKFYAEFAGHHGLTVSVVHTSGDTAAGEVVATCDPQSLAALRENDRLQPLLADQGCLLARVVAIAP